MPTVGVIKPSTRPGRAEELVAILPREIELEHASCAIAQGTRQELEQSFRDFEARVAQMAELDVDLIHPAGVPFLLLGREGERSLVKKWEAEYGIPVFTNGMSQVNALKAYGAKRVVAASYFGSVDVNRSFANYIAEAGFEMLGIAGYEVAFQDVPKLEPIAIRKFFDSVYLPHRGKADSFYLIGPAWRATLGMLDELEDAYGIPVIHHVPAQSWEIQRRLGFRQCFEGCGRLMREMPPADATVLI
jgi:maleate cis-trans isomerase